MFKQISFATGLIAIAAISPALAAGTQKITEDEVIQLQQDWGKGIVKIGQIHQQGGDFRQAAADHIRQFYAYDTGQVLFKPTLARNVQFRGTFEDALSYFVTGGISEDSGFAIAPYTHVRWENFGTVIDQDSALSMGNYYFTKTDGSEIKVEYSFGMERMDDGALKIVLHHSSIPYRPN